MEATEQTEMTISSQLTGESVTFHNVAVGEVWLAGGQSNMEFLLKYDEQAPEMLETPEDPGFRFFRYPQANFTGCLEMNPYPDDGFWRVWDTPENKGFFSGPSAYMGRKLRKAWACLWALSASTGAAPPPPPGLPWRTWSKTPP